MAHQLGGLKREVETLRGVMSLVHEEKRAGLESAWLDHDEGERANKADQQQHHRHQPSVAEGVAQGQFAVGITDTDDAIAEVRAGRPVVIVFPDGDTPAGDRMEVIQDVCLKMAYRDSGDSVSRGGKRQDTGNRCEPVLEDDVPLKHDDAHHSHNAADYQWRTQKAACLFGRICEG